MRRCRDFDSALYAQRRKWVQLGLHYGLEFCGSACRIEVCDLKAKLGGGSRRLEIALKNLRLQHKCGAPLQGL